MPLQPSTYLLRLGLYQLAMMVWDVIAKTHDILVNTGFLAPQSEQRYDDDELRDHALILLSRHGCGQLTSILGGRAIASFASSTTPFA